MSNYFGLNQSNIGYFFGAAEDWLEYQKFAYIIAVGECSYQFDPDMPTEATVAHILVSKYADHLPLYRRRQGIDLDRSTLAAWVGKAAYELAPVFDCLIQNLKQSSKLFMDETRAPVLDPGRGKTKTGYFWALARDDRPWNGDVHPVLLLPIPNKCNRKQPYAFDASRYRNRNVIERMFWRLKDFRRVATRYDKNAQDFMAALCLAALICYWI